MSCSCRLSAWRIFARSVAQVHNLEPASLLSRQRTLALPLRPARAAPVQGFHTTRSWRQDAPAESPVPAQVVASPAQQSRSSSSAGSQPSRANNHADSIDAPDDAAPATAKSRVRRGGPSGKKRQSPQQTNLPEEQAGKNTKSQRSESGPAGQDADWTPPKRERWQVQKETLKEKFPEGWQPRKRLSPDALAGIRALNAQFPEVYTTQALADKFEVSAEAIRRILKSKWKPTADEEQDRQERWFRRGKQVWERKAAFGIKPPKRWRQEGVARNPGYHGWKEKSKQRQEDIEDEEITRYRRILEEKKASERGSGPSR